MFATRLKVIRQTKSMSIKKLSQLSGVGTTEIWNIENFIKTPKIDTYCKLARALDLACYCELCDCPYYNIENGIVIKKK